MSDQEGDDIKLSAEEEVLTYDIYHYIVAAVCGKGAVKISDLKKIYLKVLAKDKNVQFRPLPDLLKLINENLYHWQGWKVVQQDDRFTYIRMNETESPTVASETERTVGLLKSTLMYVFMATKPHAKHPGVPHDDLMAYLETSISKNKDHKLSHEHMELLKKQIAPNARADFVKKGYLAWSKSVTENDEEVFRYEWGPTARQCVDPVEMVKLFQKFTGMVPSQLSEQIERAKALKKEQLEAATRGLVITSKGKKTD